MGGAGDRPAAAFDNGIRVGRPLPKRLGYVSNGGGADRTSCGTYASEVERPGELDHREHFGGTLDLRPEAEAMATNCTTRPHALPSTLNNAVRRPLVSALPTVDKTLGPGMAMTTTATPRTRKDGCPAPPIQSQ